MPETRFPSAPCRARRWSRPCLPVRPLGTTLAVLAPARAGPSRRGSAPELPSHPVQRNPTDAGIRTCAHEHPGWKLRVISMKDSKVVRAPSHTAGEAGSGAARRAARATSSRRCARSSVSTSRQPTGGTWSSTSAVARTTGSADRTRLRALPYPSWHWQIPPGIPALQPRCGESG